MHVQEAGDNSGTGCPQDLRQSLRRRKRKLRTHSVILIVAGIVIPLFGAFFRALDELSLPSPLHVPWLQVHVGDFVGLSVLFIIADLFLGATAKWRSGLWGPLGLFCWVGILIYFCLHAVCPYCRRKPNCHRDTCGNCGVPL